LRLALLLRVPEGRLLRAASVSAARWFHHAC
jgi:hypothetical protein